MTSDSDTVRGVLLAVVGVVVMSPDAMFLRLVSADQWTVLFWRGVLIGATLLVAMTGIYRHRVLIQVRAIGRIGVLAALVFAVSTVCFVSSINHTTVANTLVIIAASPLFAALLSRAALGEHIAPRTWIAVIATFAGIALIFSGSLQAGGLAGDLMALGTALMLAINFVIIRRARRINMVPSAMLASFFSALAVLPLAAPATISGHDLALLALLCVVFLPLANALITLAPRYIPAPEVSLIMLLESVFGPLWVWLALGEVPGIATVIGGALILATVLTHSLTGMRRVSS